MDKLRLTDVVAELVSVALMEDDVSAGIISASVDPEDAGTSSLAGTSTASTST
jgi:hypothetical protein